MEFHGKIIWIGDIREGVGQRTGVVWKSQDFVVESDERYVHHAKFNLYGAENVDRARLSVGMIVDVKFDVDASQWKDNWINELRAWDVLNGGRSILR